MVTATSWRRAVVAELGRQWFSLAMVGLLLLAWLGPGVAVGMSGGGWTSTLAVVLIFFFSGVSLKGRESLTGAAAWRVHLFIQLVNLAVIPLITWTAIATLGQGLPPGLQLGFFLLAAVPTTITSCVVFTQLAGGHTAATLFNAVAGNVAGVVVSPLLMAWMMGATDAPVTLDTLAVLQKLAAMVLLPLAAGQATRLIAPALANQAKTIGLVANRLGVLVIVYIAFGKTFAGGSIDAPAASLVIPLAVLIPSHLLLLLATDRTASWLGYSRADRIAIDMTAPQKTLALGLPLGAAAFASAPELLGLAYLPLMVYHPVQLIVAGVVEARFRADARRQAAIDQTADQAADGAAHVDVPQEAERRD